MALRFGHSADWHFNTSVHGTVNPETRLNRAWESHQRAAQSIVTDAIERELDAFIFSGDAFADGNPSPQALMMLANTLTPLVKAGIPLVIITGNHERLRVPSGHATATELLGLMLAPHGELHLVDDRPQLVRLGNGLQVAVLPWLSKTSVLAELGENRLDAVEGDRKVVQYALDSMERMWEEADTTAPLILASHVTIDDVNMDHIAKGHKRASELEIAHVFSEPIIPRKVIEDSPVAYAALGHIHARQRMGRKCYYAGSPDRLTFTDADDPKSYNVVTLGDDNALEGVDYAATEARLMHSIALVDPEAESRLAALEPDALVSLVLPPGEVAVPDEIKASIAEAGASIVDTKNTPVDRPRQSTVVLSEKIDPVSALSTWFQERPREDIDTKYAAALAAEMMLEEEK